MDLGYIHFQGTLVFEASRDYSARGNEVLCPVLHHTFKDNIWSRNFEEMINFVELWAISYPQ